MKPKKLIVAALVSAFALPTFADDRFPARWPVEKRIELKDGGALLIYKDGKTAVENRYGRPASVKAGESVETRSGEQIVLKSNEVQRLDASHPARDG